MEPVEWCIWEFYLENNLHFMGILFSKLTFSSCTIHSSGSAHSLFPFRAYRGLQFIFCVFRWAQALISWSVAAIFLEEGEP